MKTRKLWSLVALGCVLALVVACAPAPEYFREVGQALGEGLTEGVQEGMAGPVVVPEVVVEADPEATVPVVDETVGVADTEAVVVADTDVTDTAEAAGNTAVAHVGGNPDGICRLDKVATAYEIGDQPTPQRMEVFGGGGQHVDFYPQKGVKAVSYVLPAIPPPGVPAYWWGFGSIWEGNGPECVDFDYIVDAAAYVNARMDSGHSGLVVDLRGGELKIVANVAELSDVEVDALLAQHAEGQQESALAPTATATPTPAATCPEGTRSDHTPVVDQAWQPGTANSWRIVNFWTNEPGKDQSERKLLLTPGESPELYGGGSSWSWPNIPVCEQVARDEYAGNPLPSVTLAQLRAEGLVK